MMSIPKLNVAHYQKITLNLIFIILTKQMLWWYQDADPGTSGIT